jgi:hypothetical protein
MISWLGRGRDARDETDILFAFREWLKAQEGRVGKLSLRSEADDSLDDDTAENAFHFSPGIAATEPPIELKRLQTANKRSVGRRLSRVIVRCLIIFALVGAAVAWQQYADDETKTAVQAEVTKNWDLASGWVLSVLHIDTRPGTNAANAPTSENSNQAQVQASVSPIAPVARPSSGPPQAAPMAQPALGASQANSVAQPAQAKVAPGISPELQQKFESLQDDIADVRRIAEQIAIRQEKMVQDIAALQTAQQILTQKLLPLQSATAPAIPHARKTTYPEAVPRPIPAPRLGPPPGSQ